MSATEDLFERQDLGPFDGDENRADLERATLLRELASHPGWVELCAIVNDRARAFEDKVLRGTCKDHGDYVAAVAYAKGLREVIEAPTVYAERIARHARPDPEE